MRNGIIIPCYNEEKRLQLDEFQKFIDAHQDYVLCFVNDGSKDNTFSVLTDFQEINPSNVIIYDLERNKGKAEAVRLGVLFLIDIMPLKSIGFMDADLSTDFNDYTNLVNTYSNHSNELEMVFGSRALMKGEGVERSIFRKFMSAVVRFMIQFIIKMPIKDTQCGAKVFSIEVARDCFAKEFESRWLFDVELFIRIKRKFQDIDVMKKLKEIPLERWIEIEGSKITLQDSLKVPSQLLKISKNYNTTPYALFPKFRAAAMLILGALTSVTNP